MASRTKSQGTSVHRPENVTSSTAENPLTTPKDPLQEALAALLELVVHTLGASYGFLRLDQASRRQVPVMFLQSGDGPRWEPLEQLMRTPTAQWVMRRRRAVHLTGDKIPLEWTSASPVAELIYVPLIARGESRGVLCVVRATPDGAWQESDVKTADLIAHQAGLLIALAELDPQTRDLSRECQQGALDEVIHASVALLGGQAEVMTELGRRMRRLRQSEGRLRALLATSQDGVAIIQDHRFRDVNDRLAEMIGMSPKECCQLEDVFDLVVAGDRQRAIEHYYRRLGGDVTVCEFTLRTRRGEEIFVRTVGRGITYDGQRAVQEIWRDMSRQRRLETQLLLSEKMVALGQLIAGVAHELNNPLTTILGFSELIALNEHLPQQVRQDLETIAGEARRARKIVQNLLAFARASESAKQPTDIHQLLEETLALKEYDLRTSRVEIVKRFDPHLPLLIADADQLKQVFLNLITNAEQAMLAAHGRGRLEIRTGVKTGYVASGTSEWIEIRFRDDGPGISAEHLTRIFDPFFTTKESGQGTGLGLSISHNIIKEHGGRLYAQNLPEGGAEFTIELPIPPTG